MRNKPEIAFYPSYPSRRMPEMTKTCQFCQNWSGAPDSVMAYCTLPRAGIAFTVTDGNSSCTKYAEAISDGEGTKGTELPPYERFFPEPFPAEWLASTSLNRNM